MPSRRAGDVRRLLNAVCQGTSRASPLQIAIPAAIRAYRSSHERPAWHAGELTGLRSLPLRHRDTIKLRAAQLGIPVPAALAGEGPLGIRSPTRRPANTGAVHFTQAQIKSSSKCPANGGKLKACMQNWTFCTLRGPSLCLLVARTYSALGVIRGSKCSQAPSSSLVEGRARGVAAMRGSLRAAEPTAVRAELLDLGAPKAECESPVMPMCGRRGPIAPQSLARQRSFVNVGHPSAALS